jgi:hypothetical protein
VADNETIADAAAVPERITVQRGFVGNAESERLEMNGSGAGLITVGGRTEMSQSGAGAIVSSDEVELFQSGACIAVADRADVKQGFVGVLVASEASFSQEAKVLITAQNAILFGAVCATVFAALVALGDYFVRGMFHD